MTECPECEATVPNHDLILGEVVLGAALVSLLFVPAAYAAGMLLRRRIRRERQPAVIEAADERQPACPHVAEGGGELGFTRQFTDSLFGPPGQPLGDRL